MKTCTRIMASTLMFAALGALAGCGPDEGTDTTGTAPAGTLTETRDLDRKLPRGLEMGFAHHLLRDRIVEAKSGGFQRRVRVEYLDRNQEQVLDAIRESFSTAGYAAPRQRQLDNGNTQLRFEHEQADHKVTVTVREGGELEHSRAKGVVFLTFPANAPD